MSKIYAAQLQAVAEALEQIFKNQQYADRVIARVLKADKRRGSNDRAFIAEQTYEVVRHYRLLSHLAAKEPQGLSDWWRLVGINLILQGRELPPWREFEGLEVEALQEAKAAISKERAISQSIPNWLDERAYGELGENWPPMLEALNEAAKAILRCNRLKTTPAELQQILQTENQIETQHIGADALEVTVRHNLFATRAFKQGLFEVQDYSSQQVAPALEVAAGMTVIDACAGAGGKSLHLATLMENKGTLIAMDTEAWKLDELRKRAKRNGIQNVTTRPIEGSKTIKRLAGRADRLLLDVPCSGLGVLRRNPDAKWKLSPDFIQRLQGIQTEILASYPRMVKPGGKMVYATCSVLPSENEKQLEHFLASEAGKPWMLQSQKSYWPHREGYDGFFISVLERKA